MTPTAGLSVISHSKPSLSADDVNAVETVLRSGHVARGAMVETFEREVSRYLGFAGGIATPSGTSALYAAITALGIGSGDEVILPTYVCRSALNAVLASGAEAVLCDVEADWCVSRETIRPKLTRRTRAIAVVHTFGIAADVASIRELGTPVIEDCCQGFSGRPNWKHVGHLGQVTVLSFHATKLLTTGEGGMLLSNDPDLLQRAREIVSGEHVGRWPGYRQPMSDLQASLGCSQLRRYDTFLRRRRDLADRYFSELTELAVGLPVHIRDRSIFFRFPLTVSGDFTRLRTAFDARGVQVRRGVDMLLHRELSIPSGDFPGAERCFATTLSLPIYPAMTDEEIGRVIGVARAVFAGN